MPVALVIAAADLAVALWLLRGARTSTQPEPARITSLVLVVCAVVLVGVHANRYWLGGSHPQPTTPPAHSGTTTSA